MSHPSTTTPWYLRPASVIVAVVVALAAVATVGYFAFAPSQQRNTTSAASGPTVTAQTASGQSVTVPGGGKPSVLFFFTASCGDCGAGARAVAQAQQRAPEAAHYVAVDVAPSETEEIIRPFLEQNQATNLAVAKDTDARLTSAYRLTQVSTAVVLDSSGREVFRGVDPPPEQITAALDKAAS